jgi:putative ABC transport system permease protein
MHHKHDKPPGWAKRLLEFFCAPHLLEEIQGDLEEEFRHQLRYHGLKKARVDYVRNVLGFIRPFAIRRKKSATPIFTMKMFKHYAIVSFRNLLRNKSFSAINVMGLALGMTCCLFIYMWVKDERGVDNFHANGKKLFRLYEIVETDGQIWSRYATPFIRSSDDSLGLREVYSVPDDIKANIPDIDFATGYSEGYVLPWGHPETFQLGDKLHKLEGSRAGADFFKMFSFPLVAGDVDNALKDVSSLAISEKMSALFFASPQDALGKTIRFEDRRDFVVTAVFKDLPHNSTLKFDYLINWEVCKTGYINFSSNDWQTIIQVPENTNVEEVAAKITRYVKARTNEKPDSPVKVSVGLQPFGDQYLHSNFVNGKPDGGRIEYVEIFSGVAIFILIIACINFMNLSTARSIRRAKEVGIRKVVGSSVKSLVMQFISESMMLSFFALLISLGLTQLLLPAFNSLTGKETSPLMGEPVNWIFVLGLLVVTGVVAGSYPALYLSSLKPVKVLKGIIRFSNASIFFRKGLTVFQFAMSFCLLIATIVVSRQTDFVQHGHLGYDRENVIYVRVEGEIIPKYNLFKEMLLPMPGIAMVDRSSEAPHSMAFTVDAINWEGKPENFQLGFKPTSVGYDFLQLMNLEVVDGRGFSRAHGDSAAFMINEQAVKHMGIVDPIGKWISAWKKKGRIIGIVKDYHTNSLHESISPLILDVKEDLDFGIIMVKTEPGKTQQALASIENVYKQVNPNYAFAYEFLDAEYEKLYRNEQVISKLSNAFSVLAVMISCLGLLGLVTLSAEQRTKEIGIRKVLGATIASIMVLISKDFVKLIVVAFVIAAPIAGFIMSQWLQSFAYQIPLSWWIFALAGGVSLMFALVTISVQVVRAAVTNPASSLKTE